MHNRPDISFEKAVKIVPILPMDVIKKTKDTWMWDWVWITKHPSITMRYILSNSELYWDTNTILLKPDFEMEYFIDYVDLFIRDACFDIELIYKHEKFTIETALLTPEFDWDYDRLFLKYEDLIGDILPNYVELLNSQTLKYFVEIKLIELDKCKKYINREHILELIETEYISIYEVAKDKKLFQEISPLAPCYLINYHIELPWLISDIKRAREYYESGILFYSNLHKYWKGMNFGKKSFLNINKLIY